MLRKIVIGALGAIAVLFSTTAFAQGTAAEARAMLDKAVAAVKSDEAVALAMFIKGEAASRIAISMCSASGPRMGRPSRVRLLFQLARCQNAQGFHRQGLWSGALRCCTEARRSNHRGQLHVS